jgi:hypothetical protein
LVARHRGLREENLDDHRGHREKVASLADHDSRIP